MKTIILCFTFLLVVGSSPPMLLAAPTTSTTATDQTNGATGDGTTRPSAPQQTVNGPMGAENVLACCEENPYMDCPPITTPGTAKPRYCGSIRTKFGAGSLGTDNIRTCRSCT